MEIRFEVVPVPQGEGWLMVADLRTLHSEIVAMFRAEYAAMAQEFADRLNLRELAGRG